MSEECDPQAPTAATLAKYRAHMIAREEQFRRINQERRTAILQAQAQAEHSLSLLRAERDLRIAAEEALAAVVTSTSWRATTRLRALVTKVPRLRRALRGVAHGFARLVSKRS
jgi:hypothetical protein